MKAKEIFQSVGDTSYAYIGLLNNLSLLYRDTNNYETAHELQLEAVRLLEPTEYQVPLAISYNNLYEISKHVKGKQELSPQVYLDKATYILRREVGTEHPMYAAVLNNRADFEMEQHHYDVALNLYREALPIVKHNYGVESQAYQSVLHNLEYVKDLIKTLQQEVPCHRQTGLELGRELAHQVAQDIELNLPDLAPYMCLALVGTGSECLGFDDAISEDLTLPSAVSSSYQLISMKLIKNAFSPTLRTMPMAQYKLNVYLNFTSAIHFILKGLSVKKSFAVSHKTCCAPPQMVKSS